MDIFYLALFFFLFLHSWSRFFVFFNNVDLDFSSSSMLLMLVLCLIGHCWSWLFFFFDILHPDFYFCSTFFILVVVDLSSWSRWGMSVGHSYVCLPHVMGGGCKTLVPFITVVENQGVWVYHSFAIVERNRFWELRKLLRIKGKILGFPCWYRRG